MPDDLKQSTEKAAPLGVEPPSLVITVDEAAVLLRVNRKTVYDSIKRGELPGVRRIGGTIRLCRSSLIEWLATGQGPARGSRSTNR
jgi:excisionase family DNA binding protein